MSKKLKNWRLSRLYEPKHIELLPYLEGVRARVLGVQALIALFPILFFLIQALLHNDQDLLVPTSSFAITLGILLLNINGFERIARFGWTTIYPILILSLAYFYGEKFQVENIYFSFMIGMLIFYEQFWMRTFMISLIIGCYVLSIYFYENLMAPYADFVYPHDHYLVFVVSVGCTAVMMIEFFSATKKNYAIQEEMSEKLKAQNQQLIQLIEEKKLANESLVQSNKKLEDSNKQLAQFAYIASHDLKTPLRNVSSFVDLLDRKLSKHEDQDILDYLSFIKAGTRKMYHQVEGVLETSKYQNAELHLSLVDLNELLNEVVKNCQYLLAEKGGSVSCGVLPKIVADGDFVEKLFQNLIENALKYNVSPEPRVDILHDESPTHHCFFVQDNGIGIPTEFHEHVFKIFKRLDLNHQYEGTGIGLASCRQIVQLHGGKIWIEHPENRSGTIFKFTICKKLSQKANQVLEHGLVRD